MASLALCVRTMIVSRASSGDLSAARELCDRTEEHVPAAVSQEGKIDYAAGKDAKEQLLKKLSVDEVPSQRRSCSYVSNWLTTEITRSGLAA
jgi:hypothetical protein